MLVGNSGSRRHVVRGEKKSANKFRAMAKVVGEFHIDPQHLRDFLLEGVKIFRFTRLFPGRLENLAGVVQHNPLPDVRPGASCVDATRIGSLQHVIRRPNCLAALQAAGRKITLQGHHGVPRDASPRRPIAQIEGL